jgi:hypothetical protein
MIFPESLAIMFEVSVTVGSRLTTVKLCFLGRYGGMMMIQISS